MHVCAVTLPHLWVLWWVWSQWWSPASACGAARTVGRWSRQLSGLPPPYCGKLPTRPNHSPAGCSHLLWKTNSWGFTDKYRLVNNWQQLHHVWNVSRGTNKPLHIWYLSLSGRWTADWRQSCLGPKLFLRCIFLWDLCVGLWVGVCGGRTRVCKNQNQ